MAPWVIGWALLSGFGLGCGDDQLFPGATLEIRPRFMLGSESLECAQLPSITSLEVSLLDSAGTVARPGYPRSSPCGPITLEGPEGPGVLLLRAVGTVDEDAEATLFQARLDVDLPGAPQLLSLRPEVAFLELDWNFGDRELGPCTSEVARIDVIVSAPGATGAGLNESFGCAEGPIQVERPFSLSPHIIDVRAVSAGGFPVYSRTDQRVFERGPNRVETILSPLGGQLLLDWRFELANMAIQACDDPRVGVRTVRATVQGLTLQGGALVPDGSRSIADVVDCAAARPVPFQPARFPALRNLELVLEGEGPEHRFLSVERLVMPEGDALLNPSVLTAVGVATATVTVVSADCEPATAEGVQLVLRAPGATEVLAVVEGMGNSAALSAVDVPYGEYEVTARRLPSLPRCAAAVATESLSARRAEWGRLEL